MRKPSSLDPSIDQSPWVAFD